jgi:hypothetical protein
VALKRIPLGDPAAVRAARLEAAMLSTLDHPHLVRLHELVPIPGAVVLVLDLADAGSLAGLIVRRGRLAPGEVITALSPIGAALAYAHTRGVIHGDVTPGNVLFTRAGLPLLADLGVARIIGDDDPVHSTPAYLDPSVAAGNAPGPSSDVFMLAAVALHAVTGTPVWAGDTPAEVMARAAAGDFGDLERRLAELPPGLAKVLRRGLETQPARRCTAVQFALDLRHCGEPAIVELDAGGPADDACPPLPRQGGAHRRREPTPDEPLFNPTVEASAGSAAQFTHAVRAALRPTLPSARRRRLAMLAGSRIVRIAASITLVSAVVGLLYIMRLHRSTDRTSAASSPTAAMRPTMLRSSTPVQTASALPALPLTARAALSELAAIRERAFAQNQPGLLANVYAPGPLLTQDTALLSRVVPPGCRLVGVRTTYAAVEASPAGPGRLVLQVRAQLSPSTLICAGIHSGTGSGAGPTNLRIELVRAADGSYRVARQQRTK